MAISKAIIWRRVFTCIMAAIVVSKIWGCVCYFPAQEWNDVRLRPSFQIGDGLPLYSGLNSGPITTWMYGPVVPLLLLPTYFAPGIHHALLSAAALNTFIVVAALVFASALWPADGNKNWDPETRITAALVSSCLLPANFLIFLQADNGVVAAGLVSTTLLARAQTTKKSSGVWLSAVFAATAAFSKLHGIAVILGQVAWLLYAYGAGPAIRQFARIALAGTIWLLITLWLSESPQAAWEITVRTPSLLPITTDLEARLASMLPHILLLIGLPALLIVLVYRVIQQRPRNFSLAVLVWLASLPLGVAGSLTQGGTTNSLHGAFFVVPVTLLALSKASIESHRRRWIPGLAALGVVFLLTVQGRDLGTLPMSPQTELAISATKRAKEMNDRLWLPWRPLATWYGAGRHDHDEDGLHVRQLTRQFPRRAHVDAHLPPNWDSTLLQTIGMNWRIAQTMHGPEASERVDGPWLFVLSEPANPPGNNPAISNPVR